MTLEELKAERDKAYDRYVAATKASDKSGTAGFAAEAKRAAAFQEYRRRRDEYIARAKEAGVFEGPSPIKLRKKYRA